MARDKVDFQVVDHGTLYLLYANTRRAKQWVKENLPQDHIRYADASVVEPRYIDDITDGIRAADLDIEFSRVPLPS
jgi:hypothetical protein